jgi:hypothetical protein
MREMFCNAGAFNIDIGSCDVSRVISMSSMFKNAGAFGQDTGSWNVSDASFMSEMFSDFVLSTKKLDHGMCRG